MASTNQDCLLFLAWLISAFLILIGLSDPADFPAAISNFITGGLLGRFEQLLRAGISEFSLSTTISPPKSAHLSAIELFWLNFDFCFGVFWTSFFIILAGVFWSFAGVFCFMEVPNLCVLVSESCFVQLVVVVIFLVDVDVVDKADQGGGGSFSILDLVAALAWVGRVYMNI